MNLLWLSHTTINRQGRWFVLLLPLTVAGLLLLAIHYVSARPVIDWGGELVGDTVFDPADNPHVVGRDLIVPAGITLTIKPGAEVYFAPGAALIVRGRLLAEGTPTQTILLTRRDQGHWSAIVIDDTPDEARIAYATIEYMRGIVAEQSPIYLAYNEIHDLSEDAVRAIGKPALIQGNHIYNVYCESHGCEGIQIKDMPPHVTALVLDNHVHHTDDDCLDVNDSSVIVERNQLHHCLDKGISIGSLGVVVPGATQPSSATIVNNLVYSSDYGIAIKDSAFARLIHNTVISNREGLALYEALDHPGYGGGHARVTNTVLWGNERSIRLDFDRDIALPSTLTVAYSDVEGGWPGEGNLDLPPSFQGGGDYHLREDSPLIDAGHDEGVTVDLNGLPRLVGGAPDMGAYELQSWLHLSAWPGDRRIYLAWSPPRPLYPEGSLRFPGLASFVISYTFSPRGSTAFSPTRITGLPTTTYAYALTGLTNYVWHTVVVEARDGSGGLLERSNPVVVMPTDRFVYLPVVLRHHPTP